MVASGPFTPAESLLLCGTSAGQHLTRWPILAKTFNIITSTDRFCQCSEKYFANHKIILPKHAQLDHYFLA